MAVGQNQRYLLRKITTDPLHLFFERLLGCSKGYLGFWPTATFWQSFAVSKPVLSPDRLAFVTSREPRAFRPRPAGCIARKAVGLEFLREPLEAKALGSGGAVGSWTIVEYRVLENGFWYRLQLWHGDMLRMTVNHSSWVIFMHRLTMTTLPTRITRPTRPRGSQIHPF